MKMNSLFIIISFLTIACSHNKNDKNSNSKGDFIAERHSISSIDTLQIISTIRKKFTEINSNIKKYDIIEKDLFGQSAEGGILIAYYEQKDLKKVITTFFGETGKAVTEYYFNSGELFFVYKKTYLYDKPIYVEGSKVKSIEDYRFYYFNNDLLRFIGNNNKLINSNSEKYQEENKYIKEEMKNIKREIDDYLPKENKSLLGDTIHCKYGEKCLDTGYIIKGSRDSKGRVIHVSPKNKNVKIEK